MGQAAAAGKDMWHLRTFGGLGIERRNPAAAPSARRRPLALLALLAIAGERGLSREKIVALLWPESDEERGRNSLSQALAAVRRDLASDDLVVGTAELRLNPSVITSDVAEFEREVSSGALERAVAQYHGPFLDGVFVREAAEFERWADEHRRRLHDMYVDVLGRLARAADERGDREPAVKWWKRLAAAEPASAQAVSGLMRALAMTGDHAGAHRQYQLYERLMRQEFDVGPDPAVAALDASLFQTFTEVADRAVPVTGVAPVVEGVVAPAASILPRTLLNGRRHRYPRFAFMAGAAMLVVVSALLAWRPTRSSSLERRRIAVAPFEDLTRDTALAQVGRIAADWITQGIAQVESLDVVPSTAVSSALNDARPGSDVVRRLATVTHVGVVVTGIVVKSGDSLRVSATLVDARNNKPIRVIEQAGLASDPLVAITALRERVLGSLAMRDAMRGAALTGVAPKYAAYRAMMDGLTIVYRQISPAAFREALPLFRRAVQLDSDFAPALLSLSNAYRNTGQLDSAERVVAGMDRLRDKLSVADKLRVDLARAQFSGDYEAQLPLEHQYIARDSSPIWLFTTGGTAGCLLRPREAIGLYRAADSALTTIRFMPEVMQLSGAYHQAGDFGDELSTLERGRKLFPANRALAALELTAYAGLRRPSAALALADTLIAAISEADVSPARMIIFGGANEFTVHGDDATARLLARKITAWDAGYRGPSSLARDLAVGYAWLILGQLDSAGAHYQRAAQDSPTIANAGFLGLIAARKGDTLRARATADSLATLESAHPMGGRDNWRGVILGQLGEREQAVTLIRQSAHEGECMAPWHASELYRALRGYPPFDQLITPKG